MHADLQEALEALEAVRAGTGRGDLRRISDGELLAATALVVAAIARFLLGRDDG